MGLQDEHAQNDKHRSVSGCVRLAQDFMCLTCTPVPSALTLNGVHVGLTVVMLSHWTNIVPGSARLRALGLCRPALQYSSHGGKDIGWGLAGGNEGIGEGQRRTARFKPVGQSPWFPPALPLLPGWSSANRSRLVPAGPPACLLACARATRRTMRVDRAGRPSPRPSPLLSRPYTERGGNEERDPIFAAARLVEEERSLTQPRKQASESATQCEAVTFSTARLAHRLPAQNYLSSPLGLMILPRIASNSEDCGFCLFLCRL